MYSAAIGTRLGLCSLMVMLCWLRCECGLVSASVPMWRSRKEQNWLQWRRLRNKRRHLLHARQNWRKTWASSSQNWVFRRHDCVNLASWLCVTVTIGVDSFQTLVSPTLPTFSPSLPLFSSFLIQSSLVLAWNWPPEIHFTCTVSS